MEVRRGLIDRPNGWDAKPTVRYHMYGIALVLTFWTAMGLAVVGFATSDPEGSSEGGRDLAMALALVVVGTMWAFFLMHLRSLLLVRTMTRDMAHKHFEDQQPDEVIAWVEEHLSREGLAYERLSLTGGLPREYVPGSMRYIREIFQVGPPGPRILVQPFHHGDDSRGVLPYTPVHLGPLDDGNWPRVERLMGVL